MMLFVLNLAFEYACDMEYIEENPCLRVRRTKAETKKIEAFTVEEQRAIESEIAISDDRRLHGVLLCPYTGLRIGELLGLTWSDVDFDRGVINITKTVYREKDESGAWQLCVDTPKTKASDRVIPMPEYITNMLRQDFETRRSTGIQPLDTLYQFKVLSGDQGFVGIRYTHPFGSGALLHLLDFVVGCTLFALHQSTGVGFIL